MVVGGSGWWLVAGGWWCGWWLLLVVVVVVAGYLWPSAVTLQLADREPRTIGNVLCGIADIVASFPYDHLRMLSTAQRRQYDVWRQVAPGVELQNALHFFGVVNSVKFAEHHADQCLFDSRRNVKTWMRVDGSAEYHFSLLRGLPAWCDHCPERALYLPYDWAARVAAGSLSSVSVLSDWPTTSSYGWPDSAFGCGASGIATIMPTRTLLADDYSKVADDLRSIAATLRELGADSDRSDMSPMEALREWVVICQNSADSSLPGMRMASTKQDNAVMQVLLADSLRNDGDLKPVLQMVARALLPAPQASEVLTKLNGQTKVLTKFELSRSRFLVDGCYTLLWRQLNQSPANFAWYIMTDASPQQHREFQVTLIRKIRKSLLPLMLETANRLYFMWANRCCCCCGCCWCRG